MIHTEDPKPLQESTFFEYKWPVFSTTPVEELVPSSTRTFVEVFEQRRSARALSQAPLHFVVSTLLFALRPRLRKHGDPLKRTRRPSLSAGALHPISVVLFHDQTAYRVNDAASMLESLRVPEHAYGAWIQKCRRVLPEADGTFMVLIADMARPESAYANSESLVLRDAGAMLQTIALAAEFFKLGFCPLGVLGNEVVAALPLSGQLRAVGAGVIGISTEDPAVSS